MAVSMIGPKFYAWDRCGKPLAFGKLYTYQARTNTPKPTYQSEDQAVPNTNPVILNGEGYANVYLSGSYKMVLKDKDDNEIWTSDPVSESGDNGFTYTLTALYLSSNKVSVYGNHYTAFPAGASVVLGFNDTGNDEVSTVESVKVEGDKTEITLVDPVVRSSVNQISVANGFSVINAYNEELGKYVLREVGEYGSAPTITEYFEFASYNGNPYFAITVPYQVDPIAYPDPNSDPNLKLGYASNESLVMASGSTYPRKLSDRFADMVNVEDYGADMSGVSDATTEFNLAYNYAKDNNKALTWSGTLRFESSVVARYVEIDAPNGQVSMATGESFIIGGNASTTNNKPQTIYQVFGDDHGYDYDTDSGTPACIIKGAKSQTINLAKCPYLLFYADTNSTVNATDYSIAYSRFNFEYIQSIKFDTNPNTDGSDTQWINENEINIMRCDNFVIDGSYPHNNNRIIGGTFEGKKYIDLRVGTCNRFRDIRFEAYGSNIPTVKFGDGVRSCTVVTSWHSSPTYTNSLTANVEDNGYNNSVHNEYYEHAYLAFSDSLSLDDGFVSDTSIGQSRRPSLYTINGGYGAWYESQMVPVNNSRVEVRSLGGDNRKLRFFINFFDAEGKPYVGTSDSFISSTNTLNGDGTGTTMGAGSTGGYIQLTDPSIFFIELVVIGSFGQVSQEYQDFKYIGMQVWSMHDKSDYKNIIDSTRLNEILVSAPTLGFAKVGRVVETDEAQYKCAYSKRSTLVSVSGSTITFEDIGDTSAIKAGAIIGIPTYEGRSTQWAKVLTVNSGTSITIDEPVDANYWAGGDIAIVVWHASQYKVGISMTSNSIGAGGSRSYVTTLDLLEDVGTKGDGSYSVQPWTCLTTIDKQVTNGLIVQSVITDVNEVTTTFYNVTGSSIATESYWKPILTLSKR